MKIQLTSVLVNDQDRAQAFYTDVLGFELKHDIPMGGARWLTVTSPEGAPGMEVVLEPCGPEFARAYQQALYEAGIPITAFASTDIAAEHERLVAHGVRFRQPPTPMGPTVVAQFDDTCGNWIQLFQA